MTARELNQIADITTILSLYGIHPNRAGFIRCIAHNDNKPSMKVYTRTNSVHCFACGADFDSIGVIMHIDGCDFKHACDKIRAIFNLSDEPFARAEVERLKRKREAEARVKKQYNDRFIFLCDVLHELERKYYAMVPYPLTEEFLNDDRRVTEAADIGYQMSQINAELDKITTLC